MEVPNLTYISYIAVSYKKIFWRVSFYFVISSSTRFVHNINNILCTQVLHDKYANLYNTYIIKYVAVEVNDFYQVYQNKK